MNIVVNFDGGCEPVNPGGIATYGFIVAVDGHDANIEGGVVGTGPAMTNNVAEYTALLKALEFVQNEMPATGWPIGKDDNLTIRGDSQLVVNQVNGAWKCNKEHLVALRNECQTLLARIPCRWIIEWVPREKNDAADVMTQRAYERHTGKKFPVKR